MQRLVRFAVARSCRVLFDFPANHQQPHQRLFHGYRLSANKRFQLMRHIVVVLFVIFHDAVEQFLHGFQGARAEFYLDPVAIDFQMRMLRGMRAGFGCVIHGGNSTKLKKRSRNYTHRGR